MKTSGKILFVLLLFINLATDVWGQQLILFSGQVLDEATDEPVPSHQVFVIGNDSLLNRTYYTDENGFFRDSILLTGYMVSSLDFLTFDCMYIPHDTIIYNFNQYIIIEFRICQDSIPSGCQADFIFELDSLSQQSRQYHFYDRSTGNITSWYWDFGDSSFSSERNPSHIYADSGNYTVCLTITDQGNPVQCSDTYCQELNTPAYFSLGGLVWAGDFPLNNPVFSNDTGIVYLYRVYQGQLFFFGSKTFYENGYYWFTDLLQGDYMLKISLTRESNNYLNYIPTYFGDQVS